MKKELIAKWAKENWTVGQYTPTKTFQEIKKHYCVCKENERGLIALTGPVGDLESHHVAHLICAAPNMLRVLEMAQKIMSTVLRNRTDKVFNDLCKAIDQVIEDARGGER